MGQISLPLFPRDTVMITPGLGVWEHKGSVYYLHFGVPIFSHEAKNMNMFRYVTSNLLVQGLCDIEDIAETFHVSADSVSRWKKKLFEQGEETFFKEESHFGVKR